MSIVALFGAIETGLLYALIGLGVYLSFRVLEFPDLTVDGSFPLGGCGGGHFNPSGGKSGDRNLHRLSSGCVSGVSHRLVKCSAKNSAFISQYFNDDFPLFN